MCETGSCGKAEQMLSQGNDFRKIPFRNEYPAPLGSQEKATWVIVITVLEALAVLPVLRPHMSYDKVEIVEYLLS